MVLLGISILAISISFIFYRHPPAWPLLNWLRRSSIQESRRRHPDAPTNHESENKQKNTLKIIENTQDEPLKQSEKVDLDREMMPPPSLPPKKPASPTTPRASAVSKTTSIPSFNLTDNINDSKITSKPFPTTTAPQAPLFPAANSVQRAGGSSSTTSLPPPSFPALNSAQRASPGTNAPTRLPTVGGLMPPPSAPRSSLPNRGPPSSLAPPPTHSAIPTKPSKKVLLTPGHSPLDWARLTSSTPSLNGLPPNSPYLRVPPSLLKTMTGRKGKDAWTVLGGKVYNISPYAAYHPGGVPELMRAAGRDGTRLFGEVHPWVNWEGMLEGCLVGIAVDEGEMKGSGGLDDMD